MNVVPILAVVVPAVLTLASISYYTITRLARLELKVDTIWDFLIRRALSEAVNKGVGTVQSPFQPSAQARAYFGGLVNELREFYRTVGCKLRSDRELFVAVERRFGERFLREVCIPHGLDAGACIHAAIALMKEPGE
jgi:hypothetical protein